MIFMPSGALFKEQNLFWLRTSSSLRDKWWKLALTHVPHKRGSASGRRTSAEAGTMFTRIILDPEDSTVYV